MDPAEEKRKTKLSPDEELELIKIRSIEQQSLNFAFQKLATLEEEPSSDENSNEKQFRKRIEKKANEKKMKFSSAPTGKNPSKLTNKKFKEEDGAASQGKKQRIGIKAIRKILRNLNAVDYPKEQMNLMIWEVDEDLDGYVDKKEFERMYKRCITDEKEKEPKKLFFLVQFMMYDKENKYYITEEDTLELLYIRHKDKFNDAIEAIFSVEEPSETEGEKKKKKQREKLTYLEFEETMHKLSLQRRKKILEKKRNYCDFIEESIEKDKKL